MNSLQYGYGTVSTSPQRQRASEELGFFCEKNIYKQLAQLATARGATETIILRVLLFLALLFALCTNSKRIMAINNLTWLDRSYVQKSIVNGLKAES